VRRPERGLTLDAGALIGIEKGDPRVAGIVKEARSLGHEVLIPAAVLGQVWRGGLRQARLAAFLKTRYRSAGLHIEPLDARLAQWAGELCAARGTSDVIDASVVPCARLRRHAILTSDPRDIRRLDDVVTVIPI
jgi:predicted nucleic acid-binding protein